MTGPRFPCTLSAATDASTKELMARSGHSTAHAALIYQHATEQGQQQISDALNAQSVAGMTRGSGRADSRWHEDGTLPS